MEKKDCCCTAVRSVSTLNIQYAHRFYGFGGENGVCPKCGYRKADGICRT